MSIELAPLVAFVVVATFTPGPGNITSAAMGMNYGFVRTLPFLFGIVVGYFVIMLLCAFLSSSLLELLPGIEPLLRIAGALYILKLAWGTIKTEYKIGEKSVSPMSFHHGFLLQALNPKAIIFGLTIYSTYLSAISSQSLFLSISTLLLTLLTLSSVTLWTYTGIQIQRFLHSKRVEKSVNLLLGCLLFYCAVSLLQLPTSS